MAESLAPITAPLDGVAATAGRRRRALTGLATFAFLTAAGAAHGGYFPGSWGWLTLAAAWVALLALVLDDAAAVTRTGAAFVGLLGAYTLWSFLSAWWSVDVTGTALETERDLVYVAAVGATLLLAREAAGAVIVAAWASALGLCGYALLTRLVPDRFGVVDPISGYRLSEPIGYWNSLAMLAAMGALLALGIAAHRTETFLRAGALVSAPLFTATLYFTFSRGGWASLIVGVVALFALEPRRWHAAWWLIPAVASAVVALLFAVREHALATNGTPLPAQAHEGHRLLLLLLVLCGISAAVAIVWPRTGDRIRGRLAPYRRHARLALALLAAAGAATLIATEGSPWHIAAHAWHGFEGSPAGGGANLNGRLFHLSGTGRIDQWRVAWHEATAHPLAGSGAGTYERYWDLNRPDASKVRNVHNLYLEAFATLGIVGLALLVSAFAVPAAAIIRRRRSALVPAVGAVLAAYLAHAVVDWDWQITGVTLPVLVCAAAVCAGGAPLAGRGRQAAYLLAGLTAVLGLWVTGMQTALSNVHGPNSAHHASELQWWSTDPWQRLAEQDVDAGRFAAARGALATALAKDNRSWQLWFDLARASNGRARVVALVRASSLDPRSPEIAAFRGTLASLSSLGLAK